MADYRRVAEWYRSCAIVAGGDRERAEWQALADRFAALADGLESRRIRLALVLSDEVPRG